MGYYVYKFIGKDNEVLYVGQTIDVDRRMQEHKGRIWDELKDHIEYAECKNAADMSIYEMYYINKLHAQYNDSLVYNVEPTFTLPELDFKIYDQKVIDKMHNDVLSNARNDFANRFNPEFYWQDKKEKLEEKIKRLAIDSEEYKDVQKKIDICNENLER